MQDLEFQSPSPENYSLSFVDLIYDGVSAPESRRGFDFAKRLADILCSGLGLLCVLPLFLLIATLIRCSSPGRAIFWSLRYGKYNVPFMMPKFRTMHVGTPEVPTNELKSPDLCVTSIGRFLRQTSLDELPQLWSVLVGDMSLIGPRPVICAEIELAEKRARRGVDQLTPGLTGWAQINGRDSLNIEEKVLLDKYYLEHRSIELDVRILYTTVERVLSREGIVH